MTRYYNLQKILLPWCNNIPLCFVNDIKLNSKNITYGNLFIAVSGYTEDGRNYINEAISKGVKVILCEVESEEKHGLYDEYNNSILIIYFYQLKKYVSAIAGRFFYNPSKFIKLVGVTGTNGKTTVTHIVYQWLKILGKISAVLGTLGNYLYDEYHHTINTTGSAIDVQRMLFKCKKKNISVVSMEVSSHALEQHRVDNIVFDIAIFTNLTREHMDYHRNMQNYELSKWRLFSELNVNYYVINISDNIGRKWLYYLPERFVVIVSTDIKYIPIQWKGYMLYIIKINYYMFKTEIFFRSSWGNGVIYTKLIGIFNVINYMLSLVTLLLQGFSLNDLIKTGKNINIISGRMEYFKSKGKALVIVDYAHTPDALKYALLSAKKYCKGKLWCIFGCGGNRDKSKRRFMGAVSVKYSDKVIITDDNIREEKSYDIIKDILSGINDLSYVKIIPDRFNALKLAITQSFENDVILIAGKGHEDYQIVKEKKYFYSDKIFVLQLLNINN